MPHFLRGGAPRKSEGPRHEGNEASAFGGYQTLERSFFVTGFIIRLFETPPLLPQSFLRVTHTGKSSFNLVFKTAALSPSVVRKG